MSSEKGFTLIELLIVIGILAVLAVTAVLVINPAEYMRKSRDSIRLADLATINKAVSLYQTDGGDSFGTSNTVYVSVPDTSATCDNLGLPSLPDGWSYACVIEDNLIRVNGNGWIPVDFTSLTYGTILSALPLDPTNTVASGNYYTYTSGSWKLTAMFESEKYASNMNKDGGPDIGLYELGSDLNLANFQRGLIGYWGFDEGSGTLASDSSGNGNNGSLLPVMSTPTWTTGKSFGALSFDGENDRVDVADNPLISGGAGKSLSVMAWFKSNNLSGWIVNKFQGYNYKDYSLGFSSNKLVFEYENYGTCPDPSAIIGNTTLTSGTWYFGGFVFDVSDHSVKLYLNGALDKQETTENNCDLVNGNTKLSIGSRSSDSEYGPGGYFNGTIDDVRIYNRALSAEEISAIYNATK